MSRFQSKEYITCTQSMHILYTLGSKLTLFFGVLQFHFLYILEYQSFLVAGFYTFYVDILNQNSNSFKFIKMIWCKFNAY